MKTAQGDIWGYKADILCISTNSVVVSAGAVMGMGLAYQAAVRFPGIRKCLALHLNLEGNVPGLLWHEPCSWGTREIWSYPTKEHWRDPSIIDLVVASGVKMVVAAQGRSVVLPKVGCGLGGLNWNDVKQRLAFLPDNFTVIT